MNLVEFTNKGLYCPIGKFYIDPWRHVDYALITHGHGDHARWGNKYYLSHEGTIPIMRHRLGENNYQGVHYNEILNINGVDVSFHPAGHIIGSAQIRLSHKGEIWVVSGDYKTQPDGISPDFEPVKCNTFITESTFGLPIYRWQNQQEIFDDVHKWWTKNREQGITSVLCGYSLGKMQRIVKNLDLKIGPVFMHGTIQNMNRVLIKAGCSLPDIPKLEQGAKKDSWKGAMILAPSSAAGSGWLKKFYPYSLGLASGWMALRGAKRRQAADKGFVLSDHADWNGLNETIKLTGASKIFVTHGYTTVYSQWLREQGLDAQPVQTLFEDTGEDFTPAVEEELNESESPVE